MIWGVETPAGERFADRVAEVLPDRGWRVRDERGWTMFHRVGARMVCSGWKIHVSATPSSVEEMLRRAAPILVRAGCHFKFVRDRTVAIELNQGHGPRSQVGKMLAAYPPSRRESLRLGELLHEATVGLPGPEILSDVRHCDGSAVHYRFGAFRSVRTMSDDGEWLELVRLPNGTLVPDRREAWFVLPESVRPLLPSMKHPSTGSSGEVVLADRYVVRTAVRHAAKGGVYRALDRVTGRSIVLKEARAHVQSDDDARDARWRLRREADLLCAAPTGLVPKVLEVFDVEENTFVAMEQLPGRTLRQHIVANYAQSSFVGDADDHRIECLRLAVQVLNAVQRLHEVGIVMGDVSPNNFMVAPDGTVRVIDLEFARWPGEPTDGWWLGCTPGYSEQARGVAPTFDTDRFACGRVVQFIFTGTDPIDAYAGALLDQMCAEGEAPLTAASVSRGLTSRTRRWSLGKAVAALTADSRPTDTRRAAPPDVEALLAEQLDALVAGCNHSAARLWPSTDFGTSTYDGSVQHGHAGIAAELVRARAAGLVSGAEVDAAIDASAARARRAMSESARLHHGLYFGIAGEAWFHADLARFTGDDGPLHTALSLATRVSSRTGSPDITHGLAGRGLLALRLHTATGDRRFLDAAFGYADQLRQGITFVRGCPLWRHATRGSFAGQAYLGFAHGTAGVATFLLYVGAVTGDADLTDLAIRCADELVDLGRGDETAMFWSADLESNDRHVHWCNGSVGIGTFLVRAHLVKPDRDYLKVARAAMAAAHRARWRTPTAQCHGVAGALELALDLRLLAGIDVRGEVEDLVSVLAARRVEHEGRRVVACENLRSVSYDFGTGLAGVCAALRRAACDGPRPWMPDDLLHGGASR